MMSSLFRYAHSLRYLIQLQPVIIQNDFMNFLHNFYSCRFGLPERGASAALVQPRLKSATQVFTVENEDADSPKVASNSALISVGDKPLIWKYFITARISIFSMLDKT